MKNAVLAKIHGLHKLALRHRSRWPIAVGALLILLIAVAYSSCGRGKPKTAGGMPLSAEVKRSQLIVTVKANGEIQSTNPNKVVPAIKRSAKIKFLIPEGTRVKKGELVAKLNTEDLERRILDLENTLLERKSKLNVAQTALEIQNLDNLSNLAKAEQELIEKEMEMEKFYMGSASIDQYKAEAKKENAEAELMRKFKVYDQYLALRKKGYASPAEVDEKKLDYSKTYAEYETSRLELNQLEEYDYWINATKKKGEMDKARTELEKTRKASKTNLESKQQEVETSRRTLEAADKDLKKAREELEAHEVKAPFDSVVMYGDANFWWSRRDIQVGKDAHPGQVLVSLPDMGSLQAAVNVSEIDIQKVKIGQEATITVEAAGGKVIRGKVLTVSEVANAGQGWLSSDIKEFKVEISLDQIAGLKPALSCQAEITIDMIDSVLLLPVQAVFRNPDRQVVNPEEDGRDKSAILTWMKSGYVVYPARGGRRDVEIGRSSLREVEISGDIKPGMKVLLMPPQGSAPEN